MRQISPAEAARAGAVEAGEGAATELAEALLDSVSAIRRGIRRGGGRPEVFASLTGAQLELVRQLRRHRGSSVAELAEALGLAPNTVSTLVGELSQRGLLVRGSDPKDRRVARLELVPELRQRAEAWRDQRVAALAAASLGLSPEERSELARAVPVLGRLAARLGPVGRAS